MRTPLLPLPVVLHYMIVHCVSRAEPLLESYAHCYFLHLICSARLLIVNRFGIIAACFSDLGLVIMGLGYSQRTGLGEFSYGSILVPFRRAAQTVLQRETAQSAPDETESAPRSNMHICARAQLFLCEISRCYRDLPLLA